MRARFVGGSLDGTERHDLSAGCYVHPVPVPQVMTAARAIELLSMDAADRPRPPMAVEYYNRTVERDSARCPVGFLYTHVRTEMRTEKQ